MEFRLRPARHGPHSAHIPPATKRLPGIPTPTAKTQSVIPTPNPTKEANRGHHASAVKIG